MEAVMGTYYESQLHFRCPKGFPELLEKAARRQGLTTSSLMRMLVVKELERLGIPYLEDLDAH
jgi:hypothetical protein